MKMYGDSKEEDTKNMHKTDKIRSEYYQLISSKEWNSYKEYNLCIDTSCGKVKVCDIIIYYIEK